MVGGRRLVIVAGCWLWVGLLVGVVLAHVVVSGADGDAVVDDAVHDRVRGDVAVEALVPVLDWVLGAEHRARGVVAEFHDLQEEGAHAFVGFVEEPFVQDEERVVGVFADELVYAGGFVRGRVELFGEVGHARVQGPVGLPARLFDDRAWRPALCPIRWRTPAGRPAVG